jgi:zinc protease
LIKNRLLTVTIAWLCLVISAPLIVRAATQTEITRATLKNGLRVVIVRNALAPVVTTEINYLVGSNEAPDGFPGMAHALEHMMFRGSPGLSAAQTSTLIAAMGGSFNAATQQVVTQYFFTVPATDLETALHIEAIRMRDLLATDALWKQERGAIEQEVAQDYFIRACCRRCSSAHHTRTTLSARVLRFKKPPARCSEIFIESGMRRTTRFS